MSDGKALSAEKVAMSNGAWVVLAGLMAFTSLSTDIYLPAMPRMQQDLQGDVELTVTGFLIGFALAQIIWDPISDRYGRKRPLFIGMLIFIAGSAGCALSENIVQIVAFRVVQAFGACVGPMLARAMVRDTLGSIKAAEMLSSLTIIVALAPIIAPLLGGQIVKYSTWHTAFWLLTFFGLVMLGLLRIVPETLPPVRQVKDSLWEAFKRYRLLFANRRYMIYTACVTFYYVAVFAFVTGSPLVYISYFGIDPENFGWLFAVNVVGLMAFSYLNRFLVHKFSLDFLLKVSTGIALLAALALVLTAWFEIGGLYGIMIPVFCFISMNGVIAACCTAAALDKVPHMAGSGAALLGCFQYGSGTISSVLLSVFSDGTGHPWTMAWIMGLFGLASAIMIYLPARSKAKT